MVGQKVSNGNVYGFIFYVLCFLEQSCILVSSADFWVVMWFCCHVSQRVWHIHIAGLSGRGCDCTTRMSTQPYFSESSCFMCRVSSLRTGVSRQIYSMPEAMPGPWKGQERLKARWSSGQESWCSSWGTLYWGFDFMCEVVGMWSYR